MQARANSASPNSSSIAAGSDAARNSSISASEVSPQLLGRKAHAFDQVVDSHGHGTLRIAAWSESGLPVGYRRLGHVIAQRSRGHASPFSNPVSSSELHGLAF